MEFNVFESIKIGLASPEQIRSWSYGEVTKPETINYRTLKPERDGLYCERIFGPTKDWECHCGKYKRIRFKGKVCERCGVEVTRSKVRRERMGHIELAAPVSHIWYFKGIPSRMGLILDLSPRVLEKVLYFALYIVTDPGSVRELSKMQTLTEKEYRDMREKYEDDFEASMGAEAVKKLLEDIDCEKLSEELKKDLETAQGQKRVHILKRLEVVESFRISGNRPEWMILDAVPVIPPDIRPLVQLDGGRFATSDLNDLYRRVINRNNRLKRLIELGAPDIIVRNEKRMLQEAVDALIDNGRRGRPVTGPNNRPLKSLSDMLKGKQGRFRQNLLGKRVDYSGRSVIVVGPELKMYQCGLPKEMALELFKPFVMKRLVETGAAGNIKAARKAVERAKSEVWDALEIVIKNHPVMLNRAPTLHRLGIQAFEPVLVEGRAIKLHPLVCTAFNADFDGDQMAVHVPLSAEAQAEARFLMLAANNLLKPSDGSPVAVPSQDMVLGSYYLTLDKDGETGEGKVFRNMDEAFMAYDAKYITLHSKIKVRRTVEYNGQTYTGLVDTTMGRMIFNRPIPQDLGFVDRTDPENILKFEVDFLVGKKQLGKIIDKCIKKHGTAITSEMLDAIKAQGYKYSTIGAITVAVCDATIPPQKQEILAKAEAEISEITADFRDGFLSDGERYSAVLKTWEKATNDVTKALQDGLDRYNPIFMMADSGARGSMNQIRQLAGMRGLIANTSGKTIEIPIKANYREGLNILEYFISSRGARKGLADTALRTADSGYLTRRLVDVSQDVIVRQDDCGTTEGLEVFEIKSGNESIEPLKERIVGRYLLDDYCDENGNVLVSKDKMIGDAEADLIISRGTTHIKIRSILNCRTRHGVCKKCYGSSLANGQPITVGEAVGIIAAQSIGEPGTQLTMRTFHIGGAASRAAVASSVEAKSSGVVSYSPAMRYVRSAKGELVVISRSGEIVITENGRERERHKVPYGATLLVMPDQEIKAGQMLANWDPMTRPIITEYAGTIKFENVVENVTVMNQVDEVTGLSSLVVIDPKRSTTTAKGKGKSQNAGILRPLVHLIDENGNEVKIPGTDHAVTIQLPVGAFVVVRDGQQIGMGEVLARIPVESQKTRDITGGLPRVAELFEARSPKDAGMLAEVTGTVTFGKETKGKQRLIITGNDGVAHETLISKDKTVLVHDGQVVQKGEEVVDGPVDPHDILRLLGIEELARYIVDEVQDVYRLQGVKINDKHIEVIVRQMLRRVQITDPGDTHFITGEQVERSEMLDENDRVVAQGLRPASYDNVLLGITKASLSTDSFISAASFQETTRVLTEAAIMGKQDELRGLKENVIVGRLIPAGTGLAYHQAHKAREQAERLEAETARASVTTEDPFLEPSAVVDPFASLDAPLTTTGEEFADGSKKEGAK